MTDRFTLTAPINRRVAVIDPNITYTLLGAALAAIAWMVKQFWQSFKEASQGRKDEAQRIADERDKYRTLKFRWKRAYYELSYLAARRGVTDEEMPPTPDDDH